MIISNSDLFFQFYNDIKNGATIAKICKICGGGNMYIPSYKHTFRNDDMVKNYKNKLQNSKTNTEAIREISQEYNLAYSRVCNIISMLKKA
ncbi:MAG: hypothetical protein LBL65_03610 [Campylobacteraceae bacterium]|jgi:Mor family transcriptional regulator|nr:hypothetical protein [Campylobacteraceae bacterium]